MSHSQRSSMLRIWVAVMTMSDWRSARSWEASESISDRHSSAMKNSAREVSWFTASVGPQGGRTTVPVAKLNVLARSSRLKDLRLHHQAITEFARSGSQRQETLLLSHWPRPLQRIMLHPNPCHLQASKSQYLLNAGTQFFTQSYVVK